MPEATRYFQVDDLYFVLELAVLRANEPANFVEIIGGKRLEDWWSTPGHKLFKYSNNAFLSAVEKLVP